MAALRTLRVGAPTRRIGVSPVSDLARRRASLPTMPVVLLNSRIVGDPEVGQKR
jgi:hypothetical protein